MHQASASLLQGCRTDEVLFPYDVWFLRSQIVVMYTGPLAYLWRFVVILYFV